MGPSWVVVLTGPCFGSPLVAAFSSLLWHEVLYGLQMDICFTMVLHGLWGNNFLHPGLPENRPWRWECLISLFLLWPWYVQICTGLFLPHFFHSLRTSFLKLLSQRYWKYYLSSSVSCSRATGPDFNQMEPAVLGWGSPSPLFSDATPELLPLPILGQISQIQRQGTKTTAQQQNLLRTPISEESGRCQLMTELSLFLILCF